MPKLVVIPRQVVTTAFNLTSNVVAGAATSGAIKSLVTSFAEKALVSEPLVKLSDLDLPFWAYWLSTAGYTSHSGFKKFAQAALAKIPEMEPSSVASLVTAFNTAGYYDKVFFDAVGANVSDKFAKYETEELLSIVAALHKFGHYDAVLFDDIADSLAYCNHYLSPMKVSPVGLATVMESFAKNSHDRADLFTWLSRGFSEIAFGKLSPGVAKDTALTALRAYSAFNFWPDATEALLYVVKTAELSADEAKEVAAFQSVFEELSGGKFAVFKAGDDVDIDHWVAHNTVAPTGYSLYAFRDSLVPKEYSPLAMRPAPTSV
ncbi:MAG: hypothetical protein WDW38_010412 [Sanguina aurantia]